MLLFSAASVHAANVKNVQRGAFNWGTSTLVTGSSPQMWEVVVTLPTAVDSTKAYVNGDMRTTSNDPTHRCTFELTDTTLRVRSHTNSNALDIEWEVAEFFDVTVHRGVTTMSGTTVTQNVTFPAVVLARSVLMNSERTPEATASKDECWTVRSRFTNTTTAELTRLSTSSQVTSSWQVIEFDATTSVQSGLTTVTGTSATATITSIDTTKSFLMFNRRGDNTKGKEMNYMVSGFITSSTQLNFTRENNEGSVDVSWFVVSLGPDSLCESGTVNMAMGATTVNVNLAAVDPTKTITFVAVYGGGSDVNKLGSDTVSSQLISATTLRMQRKNTDSVATGTWFVVQYTLLSATRETADLDGDGHIDAIRFVAFEPLNDNFTGLTISVTGYTVTGYTTGTTANDTEFYALLMENVAPDTAATPATRFVTNTSLRGTTSNVLLRTEGTAKTPTDKAKPVLIDAEWINVGSTDGVDANDRVDLTFSENVTSTGVLIADVGLPVTGDSFGTATIGNQGPATIISITLVAGQLLTPGGTYSVGSLAPGSPTGVFIVDGTRFTDSAAVPNTALNQGFSTAVDLRPGNEVVAIAWSDHTIAPRTWNIDTDAEYGGTYTALTATPSLPLAVINSGSTRTKFTLSCTVSSPNGWTCGAAAGINIFEMKADASAPLDNVHELDLATGPKDFSPATYSGYGKDFDLRFVAPTEITSGVDIEQNITVTVIVTKN